MSQIRVRIQVEIAGPIAEDNRPTDLAWLKTLNVGDNPRYYGDGVQRAIEAAAKDALRGSEVYVDLRGEQ